MQIAESRFISFARSFIFLLRAIDILQCSFGFQIFFYSHLYVCCIQQIVIPYLREQVISERARDEALNRRNKETLFHTNSVHDAFNYDTN